MRIHRFCALLAVILAMGDASAQGVSESARRERVMQWAANPNASSCKQLQGALTDASADIRGRAANGLYWNCDRATTGATAVKQLCGSADLGTASAAVYLLLGYGPKAEAEPCLRKPRTAWPMVKSITASKPVAVAFAARIALARLGDETALTELRAAFAKNSVDEALFLLAVLPDIQDRASISGAIKLLDDERECPGVRSEAKRKVRDAAADALVQRFQIVASGYPLRALGKRYAPAEIERIRKAAELKP